VATERVVLLGLGNVLLGDDGIGVVALQRLAAEAGETPGVEYVDGGTLGMALLDYFEPDATLILIDAVRTDAAPGTVVVLEGEDVARAASARLSPHQVGVADLLDAAELLGRTPRRLVLVGVVPQSISLSIDRTPVVQSALPALLEAVRAEVARSGIVLARGFVQDDAYALVEAGRAVGI
jgi:hydrogenase maturation protease